MLNHSVFIKKAFRLFINTARRFVQVDNRIKHSKPGKVETIPEKKKKVVKELT